MEKRNNKFTPLILAIGVVAGIVIGTFYSNHFSGNRLNIINSGSNRINNLLHIIDENYVDTVNINELIEKSIPQILAELDPHSVYINAKDAQIANEQLKGSFSGIGIELTLREDTIRVQNVIKNGPAERAGIIAGDKIVFVDKKTFVAKSQEEVLQALKGKKGTKVSLGVIRYGQKKPLYFNVTRDDIQTKSLSAAYMLDKETGYIKIKSFNERTYEELIIALAKLSQEGMNNIVVDLRDNPGGLLTEAIKISNEFLPDRKMIVYTQGRKVNKEIFYSDGRAAYKDIPLVVLINENSASASEIFAGAMQDNDRATIIGRRSFGKGLVQKQINFSDGSMINLTIARYYSPSGRCIQKPYTNGNDKNYMEDILQRYKHGEFFNQDSIKNKGHKYYTTNGRIVYGGGGISPDIFIAEDTSNITSYYKEAAMSGLLLQYSFIYTDANRVKLTPYKDFNSMLNYIQPQTLVDKFATYANQNGLKRRNILINKSYNLLEQYIYGRVIYNMLNEEEFIKYVNMYDPAVTKALDIFKNDASFPKTPNKKQ